jgi:hypothetical protein
MRFTLRPRNGSATFQKITTGKKWVGRVGECADGRWFGKIGSTMVYSTSARAAFDLVVAKHLGFGTADALRSHNSRVSQQNRQVRAARRHAFTQMMNGDFAPLEALFGNSPRTFRAASETEEN